MPLIPGTMTEVNLETGEEKTKPMNWFMLPPPADCCQECAVKHEPWNAHDAQSLYYQMKFNAEHGRSPTWLDAIAHCTPELQKAWKEGLRKKGVEI